MSMIPCNETNTGSSYGATVRTPLFHPAVEGLCHNHPTSASTQSEDVERVILVEGISFLKFSLIMLTAWLGFFLGAADSTIISTLSAPISNEFQSLTLLSWLATAYLISNAACQPISGRLTDIFGRGRGLVFCNVVFAAGNLICGVATNQRFVILGRAVAGIGGGGLMSIATFLGSDLVPLRHRGIVHGLGNIWYGAGAVAGGVLGGFFNDHTRAGWRLAFLVQVPISLVCAVAAFFLVDIPPKQSDKSTLARIDYLGALLMTSFLVLLLLGLNSGGDIVVWTHTLPLTSIALSVVSLFSFIYWETKAKLPILPIRLLYNRTVFASCLANFLATIAYFVSIFFVPLFLQVRGCSASATGMRMLFAPLGVSLGSLGAGFMVKKMGTYVRVGMIGISLLVCGCALFMLQNENSRISLANWGFLLVGAGFGSMLNVTLLASIAALDHSQQAVTTSAICEQPITVHTSLFSLHTSSLLTTKRN